MRIEVLKASSLFVVGMLMSSAALDADSTVIGEIRPPGLNWASSLTFDSEVNPLVIDGAHSFRWMLLDADEGDEVETIAESGLFLIEEQWMREGTFTLSHDDATITFNINLAE